MSTKGSKTNPGPFFCTIPTCKRADPTSQGFASAAGRGSHLRRNHGIVAVARIAKRPPGGSLRCPYPECAERQPYVSISGRETHLRVDHGSNLSENPDSVRKRKKREIQREIQRLMAGQGSSLAEKSHPDPPPPSPATTTHESAMRALTPGEIEYLRLRLLYVVNGTWAREIDAPPKVIRDTIAVLCRTNFAPRPRRREPPRA